MEDKQLIITIENETNNISIKINDLSLMDLSQMVNGLIRSVKNNHIKNKEQQALFKIAMEQAVTQAFEENDDEKE